MGQLGGGSHLPQISFLLKYVDFLCEMIVIVVATLTFMVELVKIIMPHMVIPFNL